MKKALRATLWSPKYRDMLNYFKNGLIWTEIDCENRKKTKNMLILSQICNFYKLWKRSRAALVPLAGHMRPAGRVFETAVLRHSTVCIVLFKDLNHLESALVWMNIRLIQWFWNILNINAELSLVKLSFRFTQKRISNIIRLLGNLSLKGKTFRGKMFR